MSRRIYTLYEAMSVVATAARLGKPRKYIWVQMPAGLCKLLRPTLEWDGLKGDMKVSVKPRYQCRLSN